MLDIVAGVNTIKIAKEPFRQGTVFLLKHQPGVYKPGLIQAVEEPRIPNFYGEYS